MLPQISARKQEQVKVRCRFWKSAFAWPWQIVPSFGATAFAWPAEP
jgi:hypothetical protein